MLKKFEYKIVQGERLQSKVKSMQIKAQFRPNNHL